MPRASLDSFFVLQKQLQGERQLIVVSIMDTRFGLQPKASVFDDSGMRLINDLSPGRNILVL